MRKRRPIMEIMNSTKEYDIIFIQPHLLSNELKIDQNKIVVEFWETMHKHAVLLGDIPSEPNHGIFFMAGSLIQAGYSVEVLDFHALDRVLRKREDRKIEESDIIKALKTKKTKIFGISSKTVAIERGIRIAELIRSIHPDAKIIFGGLHPTLFGEDLLENNYKLIDFIVQGEGEQTIVELLHSLKHGMPVDNIKNLLYKNEQGKTIKTQKRLVSDIDIDSLPYPAYELICEESTPLVPRILSARGCPHECAFCSIVHYYERKVRIRDPKKVVDEIEYMINNFNIKFYCLGDLTFMINKNYSHTICNELIDRGLNEVKWWCQTTVGRINNEDVKLMKKAGCVQVAFGVEADSQEILDLAKKPRRSMKTEEQCRILKDEGLSVQTYWLIGLGKDTFASALNRVEDIRYFIQNGLTDAVHISVAVPFPGTPIWYYPEKFGYKINHRDFSKYWMNCDELGYGKPAVDLENLSADHIYMFWQLALATATEEFKNRISKEKHFSHFIPEGLFESTNGIPAFS